VHKVKYTEMQKRKAELRDLQAEIQMTLRELIPMTTGD
jgi:sensor histidine kinase YesM